jgi:hypothetical protein
VALPVGRSGGAESDSGKNFFCEANPVHRQTFADTSLDLNGGLAEFKRAIVGFWHKADMTVALGDVCS